MCGVLYTSKLRVLDYYVYDFKVAGYLVVASEMPIQ